MGDSLFGIHGMALELRAQRLGVLTSNIVTVGTSPLTFVQFTINPTTIQVGPLTGDVTTSGSAATLQNTASVQTVTNAAYFQSLNFV